MTSYPFQSVLEFALNAAIARGYNAIPVFVAADGWEPTYRMVIEWCENRANYRHHLRIESFFSVLGGWGATIYIAHSSRQLARVSPDIVELPCVSNRQECPRCDGLGEVCVSRDVRAKECRRCKGTGVIRVPDSDSVKN